MGRVRRTKQSSLSKMFTKGLKVIFLASKGFPPPLPLAYKDPYAEVAKVKKSAPKKKKAVPAKKPVAKKNSTKLKKVKLTASRKNKTSVTPKKTTVRKTKKSPTAKRR